MGGPQRYATADLLRSPESNSDHYGLRPTRVGSRSTRIHRSSFSPPPIKLSHREEEPKQREEDTLKPRKSKPNEEEVEEETVPRPWNLRPRKVVTETSSAAASTAVEKISESAAPKSMRLRVLAENGGVAEKKEKRKFSITLSKDEVKEDIFVITGSRPARRPKNIQMQLDNVFPGLWLVGMTPETYSVADTRIKK